MTKKAIVWIREDFRIEDNEALAIASQNHEFVSALYIYNPKNFDKKREAQKWWVSKALENFNLDLKKLNITLEIQLGDELEVLSNLKKKDDVTVYWSKVYEPDVINKGKKIRAGECAVPGIIALIGSFNNKEYLDKLELNEQSNVLLFGCEGLTDNAMYQKLLSDGLQKI